MRSSGVLMPIFSLPSPHGIGTLGKEAFEFIDFLAAGGQTYWQILPINPTNYGDSPYQSFSSFAGNPYFIDLELLQVEGLLTKEEIAAADFGEDPLRVDYGKLYQNRLALLKCAHERFVPDDMYQAYLLEQAGWLLDYALFMALKNAHQDRAWTEWEKPLREREEEALKEARKTYQKQMDFYCFLQYKFTCQWKALKGYANEKGIGIIGDIPIYVAYDSADVWANPEQFLLDEERRPQMVAGCPPDAFTEEGQLWGNPLYNWQYMKQTGYRWWKGYLGQALARYDLVRIDHFRGFESFYAIPFGDQNAVNGKWMKGPDIDLFDALKEEFGKKLPIIAEDLGFLTPPVRKMLKKSGFPGMKVLQFAFDSREESDYLPHNYERNCVVYTGTHDNDTIFGWVKSADPADVETARRYLNVQNDGVFNWAMMKGALMSVADTCILTMQDLIGMDERGRINTPSTLGGNWQWRIEGGCINSWLSKVLYEQTRLYGRLPKKKK